MSNNLHYTNPALADFDDIYLYTLEKWGREQARRYVGAIETCCENVAKGDVITRSFSADGVECRVCRCEHHYIFLIDGENSEISVVAVFHEKMDLIARLTERLQSM